MSFEQFEDPLITSLIGETHKPKIKFLPWNALRLSASATDSQICPCPGMRLCLIRFFHGRSNQVNHLHATSRAKKSISKSEKLVSLYIFQNEYLFNNYGQTLFLNNIFYRVCCVKTEKKDIFLHKTECTHCKSWILCANIFPRKICSHVLDRLGVGVFVLNFFQTNNSNSVSSLVI